MLDTGADIPVFCKGEMLFKELTKEMKVAVIDKPKIPCDMILSASMFMKMKYVIDCSLRKHTLTIMADKKEYGVGYYNKKETIYIFSRE